MPKNPRGVRFSADSTRLYVACEQAHVLAVIDVATRSVTRTASTGGSRPVDVMPSIDGRRLFVSHGQSADVRILDAETLAVRTVVPVGPRAWWIALTPDGRHLWVTVGRAGEVVVIDTEAERVTRRVAVGTLPWGIAIADVAKGR